MNDMIKWLMRAGAVALAWLCRALGGWDGALGLLFLTMGLDLLTGLLCAGHGKSGKTAGGGFLSGAFFSGLTRKLMVMGLVMLAAALDRLLGTQGVSRLAVIGFYAANEGLSIVENAALLGLPFPRSVLAVMEKLRDREMKEG